MKTRRGFDRDLHWLGDKKSVQQADPQLQPFVDAHFPGARFIHMTRHPRAVVASMVKAGRQWQVPVPYWREGAEHILERWIEHERWALAVDGPVLRLRFEDLCADPAGAMRRAFQFLDVDNTTALEREAAAMTKPDPDRKHADFALPPSADAEKLMQRILERARQRRADAARFRKLAGHLAASLDSLYAAGLPRDIARHVAIRPLRQRYLLRGHRSGVLQPSELKA